MANKLFRIKYKTKPLAIDTKWKVITRTVYLWGWRIHKTDWMVMPNNQVVRLHYLLAHGDAQQLLAKVVGANKR